MNDAFQFEHAEYAGDQPLECGACQHSNTRGMLSVVAGMGAAVAGALLYLAIVSSSVPPVVQGLQERGHQTAAATTAAVPAAPLRAERPSVARFAAAVAVVSVTVFVTPSLMGFKNAIGLVIIAVDSSRPD